MSAAQMDWDDQHGRMPPLIDWWDSLPAAAKATFADDYAAKLARMIGPNPVSQEGDGS